MKIFAPRDWYYMENFEILVIEDHQAITYQAYDEEGNVDFEQTNKVRMQLQEFQEKQTNKVHEKLKEMFQGKHIEKILDIQNRTELFSRLSKIGAGPGMTQGITIIKENITPVQLNHLLRFVEIENKFQALLQKDLKKQKNKPTKG